MNIAFKQMADKSYHLENKRVFGLDLFRSVAIILVLLNHSVQLLIPLTKLNSIGGIIGKLIAICQPFGMLGVELFFVLSGFLIGKILLRQFMNSESFTFRHTISFWKRRWFRTLPTYYLVLFVLFIISQVFNWNYIFFSQSVSKQQLSFFPESWSLTIEEWFYFLLPLYLLFINTVFPKLDKYKKYGITIITFIALFTVIRILIISNSSWDLNKQIRTSTFLRPDSIGFGVLMSFFWFFHQKAVRKYAKFLFYIGSFTSVLLVLIYYLGTHPQLRWYERIAWFKWIENAFFFSVIPISLSLMLPASVLVKPSRFMPVNSFVKLTSKISYSLYLIHLTLLLEIVFKPLISTTMIAAIPNAAMYVVTCYLLAWLMYNYFELPTTRLRDGDHLTMYLKKVKEQWHG